MSADDALHEGQHSLTRAVAERLLREQAPAHVELPADAEIHLLTGAGTTSHVVRVGEELVARFPLIGEDPRAVRAALGREHAAMAELAGAIPVPAPRPLMIGRGGHGYPLPWSLQTWVPGEIATPTGAAGSVPLALDLAQLLKALRAVPTRGRTFSGTGRGGDLRAHDAWIAECLARSEHLLPVPELSRAWERWRELPREDVDVMSHQDLIPANLLLDGGAAPRLAGVLDSGGFGPADPALDLVVAWHLLDAGPRALLREHLRVPELTWRRGEAWAFAQAIGLVWYYERTSPAMAELGRSTLVRLLADAGS
ncbi:aminoglycoside phosphotransferase family protein [Brachybacterium horti]|uniref:phosphotransferase n=1 Tax=Brachybacterium sp. SGAir0954 TaxID=2571029 RepID=UPI001F114542|nr:phosphotransferase [Brachybacterium sp. SGAir0954]